MNFDKFLDLKIQGAVLQSLGNVFDGIIDGHFLDHAITIELDHETTLMRIITRKFVNTRLRTYGRRFTQIVAHKNQPSLRHEFTKLLLFKNQ